MNKQICECDSKCNPKDYEGRTMLQADEGWHNWYFNDPKRRTRKMTDEELINQLQGD